MSSSLFIYVDHLDLHSFPTRRSSDLCKLQDGQRGLCFVRKREGDKIVLTTYGRSSGFCIDPIEKKPLNQDRKSTRLNSSHANISYAVFCLKKKKKNSAQIYTTN